MAETPVRPLAFELFDADYRIDLGEGRGHVDCLVLPIEREIIKGVGEEVVENVKKIPTYWSPLWNAFCPTGKGGGIDTSCGSGKGGGTATATPPSPAAPTAPKSKKGIKSDAEAKEWLDKHAKPVLSNLSPAEKESIHLYQNTPVYRHVQNGLRRSGKGGIVGVAGRAVMGQQAKTAVKHLDNLMEKSDLPEGTVLHRAMRVSKEEMSKLGVGKTIKDSAYSSTSLREDRIEQFMVMSDRVRVEITAGKGAKGLSTEPSLTGIKSKWDEKEILLPRGSEMKITSIEKDSDGRTRIKAELQPYNPKQKTSTKVLGNVEEGVWNTMKDTEREKKDSKKDNNDDQNNRFPRYSWTMKDVEIIDEKEEEKPTKGKRTTNSWIPFGNAFCPTGVRPRATTNSWIPFGNAFCPTGKGGGVDPTCTKGSSSISSVTPKRGEEAAKQVKKDQEDWRASLSLDEISHLKSYSSNDFTSINGYLRRGNLGDLTEHQVKESIEVLDKALSKAVIKEPIVVTRTINKEYAGDIKAGDIYSDKAYLSTSTNKRGIDDIHRNLYVMEISLKVGSNGAYLEPWARHDFNAGENEVLLPRGSKFRVVSVEGRIIKLETDS